MSFKKGPGFQLCVQMNKSSWNHPQQIMTLTYLWLVWLYQCSGFWYQDSAWEFIFALMHLMWTFLIGEAEVLSSERTGTQQGSSRAQVPVPIPAPSHAPVSRRSQSLPSHLTLLDSHCPFSQINFRFLLFPETCAWEPFCPLELHTSAGGWSDQHFCNVSKTWKTLKNSICFASLLD